MQQKIKQVPCAGAAASHHGLLLGTGDPDWVCMATYLLSDCQPLALQGMELLAEKMQCRGFGAGAFHFPQVLLGRESCLVSSVSP